MKHVLRAPPRRSRQTGLAIVVLVAAKLCFLAAAAAQPMQLPGAAGSTPVGTPVAPPPAAPPGTPSASPRPAAPPPVRVVAEDAVVGQGLAHQGRSGRFVMERMRGGYGLKFAVDGFQTSNLLEPCAVSFGEQAVALESLGRPEGLPRFKLQSSVCPIVFDVLNNALLVVEPQAPCVIEAAQCRISPRGLWSPDARGLVTLARELERERSRAEAQVREGFRQLSARGSNEERRLVAREQAGFSSEREQICREFAREPNHGFCATKITEAKAASLRARLNAKPADEKARR